MGLFDSIKNIGKSLFGGGSGGSGFGGFLDFAGTAIGLYSGYKSSQDAEEWGKDQSKAIKNAAKANRKLSLYDAKLAAETSREIRKQTERDLAIGYRRIDSLIGSQKTSFAKGGAVTETGTPGDVVADTLFTGFREMEIIRYEGRKAEQRALDMARRYEMLADAGFRDQMFQASMIEKQASARSSQLLLMDAADALNYVATI